MTISEAYTIPNIDRTSTSELEPSMDFTQLVPASRATDDIASDWTSALMSTKNKADRTTLTVLGRDHVIHLNGADFDTAELQFLRDFDWSWDLDVFSELADLPGYAQLFGELLSQSKKQFGENEGQSLYDRLMRVEISCLGCKGNVRTERFGRGLFRFSGVKGAFFADPERARAFVNAFASKLEARH